MSEKTTIGMQLIELRRVSGLSMEKLAKAAGYAGRSSVQRYFDPGYDPDYLPRDVADALADGFAGTDVSKSDIMALAGLPVANATIQKFEGASHVDLRRDVPIYGTALGAPCDFDGRAIEQTMLNKAEIIEYAIRPTVLNRQQYVYGLYVQGTSMFPRYDDGELIFVTEGNKAKPPSVGDDVVIYLGDGSEGDNPTAVLVKRLVRRNNEFIELQQFNPAVTFKIRPDQIMRIDRVLPWSELLS